MPIFDPVEQRLCVRIVYDGAGGAGKTTNLKALSNLFASQRATELFSPGEADGRTLYFDWLQILAGSICGFPLMCQVISVPGQTVLTPRRRHLLAAADVVVVVCDSDRTGLERTARGLSMLEEMASSVPILLQANKQDRPNALSGRELVAALGRDLPVVDAIATDSIGVVDTFVRAVRAVSRGLQERNEAGTLVLDVGRAPAAEDTLTRLRAQTLDPEWAAEMFLEEAQSAFLIAGGFEPNVAAAMVERVAPPVVPGPDVETGFVWPAHTGRLALRELATDDAAQEASLDADGHCMIVIGKRRLSTSRATRFVDREEARHALVRAARERTQLDLAAPSDTILVLQPARDGAFWLWSSTPIARPLSSPP